jgi:hypothetical protein
MQVQHWVIKFEFLIEGDLKFNHSLGKQCLLIQELFLGFILVVTCLKFVGRTNLIINFCVKLYNEVLNKTVSTRLDSWAWIQIANIQSFCYLTFEMHLYAGLFCVCGSSTLSCYFSVSSKSVVPSKLCFHLTFHWKRWSNLKKLTVNEGFYKILFENLKKYKWHFLNSLITLSIFNVGFQKIT